MVTLSPLERPVAAVVVIVAVLPDSVAPPLAVVAMLAEVAGQDVRVV